MGFEDVLALIGGLALFLYGMSVMGEALEKCAGSRLKSILTRLMSSRWHGFLLGLGVTAVIQSSSATTVMVVGFVNSGLMTLSQSVYVIMGANVGTSVTSWILSLAGVSGSAWYVAMFKPATFTPVLALAGVALMLFSKRQRRRDAAGILLGFAVLMFGMEMMSGAVAPLAEVPQFGRMMTAFANPVLGVLAGALLTAVIQSSSASVGILQALSLTGGVTWAAAIPVIMGQNIGTCATALLSSVGATRDARRASVVHLAFNVVGTAVWLAVFCAATAILRPAFTAQPITPLGIAIAHSTFNLLSTVTLFPFGERLAALARAIVPDGKPDAGVIPLDERLFVTPSVALERAHRELNEMAQLSVDALNRSMDLLANYDEAEARRVSEAEDRVDAYEDALGSYLVKLAAHSMTGEDSRELSKYLHMIGDLERLSDHAVNLVESAQEIREKELRFPEDTQRELATIVSAVREILFLSLSALWEDDLDGAGRVEPLEQVIDVLNRAIRDRQIGRLTRAKSTIEMGFVLSDILTNLERAADHCSNLAIALIETARDSFDMHGYQSGVEESAEYRERFEEYLARYALPDAGNVEENKPRSEDEKRPGFEKIVRISPET